MSSYLLNDMNFNEISGKIGLMIILKVTKKQGFMEDTILEKPQVRGQIDPLSACLGLICFCCIVT